MTLDTQDTIVAIASAPGGAVRGILRMSGPEIVDILDRCAGTIDSLKRIDSPTVVPFALACDSIQLPGELYLWPTSRSYTRQPAAEFHTMGSPPLLQIALNTLRRHGARLARPGEFTLRAFLSGRLDLTQAEAVLGIIDAAGTQQLETALTQLAGGLTEPLQETRNQLLDLCADLEAGLDFVEDDIEFVTNEQVIARLISAIELLNQLSADMDVRRVEHGRPTAALVGAPNAGKSSLLNALADDRVALVSATAGTTRDIVSGRVMLSPDGAYSCASGTYDSATGSIECELFDTAGIEEAFEAGPAQTAQEMTSRQLERSRLTIACFDGSTMNSFCMDTKAADADRQLCVITKGDLPMRFEIPDGAIVTSAESGQGLDQLKVAMFQFFRDDEGSSAEVVTATAVRCAASLQMMLTSLNNARQLAEAAVGDELVGAEIRLALHQLGEIVGEIYTDDILDRVFSRFCIGK